MENMNESNIHPDIRQVSERATAAGWEVEWRDVEKYEYYTDAPLIIRVPNGRESRQIQVSNKRAQFLLRVNFEEARFLGDLHAIDNKPQGYIEAQIASVDGRSQRIWDLPGVEVIGKTGVDNQSTLDIEEIDDEGPEISVTASGIRRRNPNDKYRLKIEDEHKPWSVEFSEASDEYLALSNNLAAHRARSDMARSSFRTPTTIKLRGIQSGGHDQVLHLLETYTNALFYEFDLKYRIFLQIPRVNLRSSFRGSLQSTSDRRIPDLPNLQYSKEALSLYGYARGAVGLPLLQFLAYYQVLEFFFPQYVRQEVLKRVRHELADPRFDATNEADLARLISISNPGGGSYVGEREQLKSTIFGIVDEESMREWFLQNSHVATDLQDKKRIKGVPPVNLENRGQSILDQVSSRVYAIRCRVVHTKSDGQDSSDSLLLPGSKESERLKSDVYLLEYLAQKAILAGAAKI